MAVKEERMMNKAGAVGRKVVAGLFILAIWMGGRGVAVGQMPAMDVVAVPVESGSVDPTVSEIPRQVSPAELDLDQRLEALQSADLATLKDAYAQAEKKAQELAVKGPELRFAARAAYDEARLNSDVAKEIHQQRADLEKQLDQALRDLPEVKEKLEEIEDLEREMLAELRLRTVLAGLIAAREKEMPTPVSE